MKLPACLIAAASSLALVSCATAPFTPVMSTDNHAASGLEGRRISRHDIIHVGKKSVDEARIRSQMKTRAGLPYSSSRADDDLKSLYESGLVDDVVFKVEPDGDEVSVTTWVTTRPALCCGPVYFVGNSQYSDQRLSKDVARCISWDGPWHPSQIEMARRRVEAYYHRRGFTAASVSARRLESPIYPEDPELWSHCVFTIEEGPWTKPENRFPTTRQRRGR